MLIAVCIVVLLVIGVGIFSAMTYSTAFRRKPAWTFSPPVDREPTGWEELEARALLWLEGQAREEPFITANDGCRLRGLFLPSANPGRPAAVIVHGYTMSAESMLDAARLYRERFDFNVLLPDCRAHGKSGGAFIGFGWLDRLDLLPWLGWIVGRLGTDVRIALHGQSMGGATVLCTGGEPLLPPNVRCVVSDCAFSTLREILARQIAARYHLPPWPFLDVTSLVLRLSAGYSVREASPLAQVRKSRTPTLFIHGGADDFVPTAMASELFDAAPCPKELFIVAGAAHGEATVVDPAGCADRIERFLARFGCMETVASPAAS